MVKIHCPRCGTVVDAADDVVGKTVSCGACRHVFIAVAYAAGPLPGGPATTLPPGERTSGQATASMVLGIISIPTCILYGIPSLVCGILAVVFAIGISAAPWPHRRF